MWVSNPCRIRHRTYGGRTVKCEMLTLGTRTMNVKAITLCNRLRTRGFFLLWSLTAIDSYRSSVPSFTSSPPAVLYVGGSNSASHICGIGSDQLLAHPSHLATAIECIHTFAACSCNSRSAIHVAVLWHAPAGRSCVFSRQIRLPSVCGACSSAHCCVLP